MVDGNYESRARKLIWPCVEVVVWLDPPLWRVMTQVTGRTIRRLVTRDELWSGNREGLRETFSRNSILWWALSTFGRRRREYRQMLASPPYPHIEFV